MQHAYTPSPIRFSETLVIGEETKGSLREYTQEYTSGSCNYIDPRLFTCTAAVPTQNKNVAQDLLINEQMVDGETTLWPFLRISQTYRKSQMGGWKLSAELWQMQWVLVQSI